MWEGAPRHQMGWPSWGWGCSQAMGHTHALRVLGAAPRCAREGERGGWGRGGLVTPLTDNLGAADCSRHKERRCHKSTTSTKKAASGAKFFQGKRPDPRTTSVCQWGASVGGLLLPELCAQPKGKGLVQQRALQSRFVSAKAEHQQCREQNGQA